MGTRALGAVTLGLVFATAGCGEKKDEASPKADAPPDVPVAAKADDAPKEKPKVDKESDSNGKKLTPAEVKYVEAATPFVQAIADKKYDAAYALLSSYAKQRMSLNQFVPPDDDATAKANEDNAATDVTLEKFSELMKKAEERYGAPHGIRELYLFSSDPKALAPEKREGLDGMDAMFAIGMMPDSIPKDIRRASLRGKVDTQLSEAQLADEAKKEGITVDELKKDEDFKPYFTLKTVIIEQDGKLTIGYFEMLPPGIMD